jgi:hypothetical protein
MTAQFLAFAAGFALAAITALKIAASLEQPNPVPMRPRSDASS